MDDSAVIYRDLMALKAVGSDVYESTTAAFSPGNIPYIGKRTFGGHVYAQAVWAASQTVEPNFYAHSVSGNFLLAGRPDTPFIYHVKRVRDGSGYCLRTVEVFQHSRLAGDGKVPCFFGTVSFKRPEQPERLVEYQYQNVAKDHVQREYAQVLAGKEIEDHPPCPGFDAENLPISARETGIFPGCDMRKVDMGLYNGPAVKGGGNDGEVATHWRQLTFYRLLETPGQQTNASSLNLHASAHSYASDRNGLFMIQRALGYEKHPAQMGTLSHTITFHGPAHDYDMFDTNGLPKWFVQEAWTSNGGDNRICHNSRIWDYHRGRIIATTVQDGMMRVWPDEISKL